MIEKLVAESKFVSDVNTTLTTLILNVISSRDNMLDTFVVLYATLIASLHKIVGIEFGLPFSYFPLVIHL